MLKMHFFTDEQRNGIRKYPLYVFNVLVFKESSDNPIHHSIRQFSSGPDGIRLSGVDCIQLRRLGHG